MIHARPGAIPALSSKPLDVPGGLEERRNAPFSTRHLIGKD
nr:MAG TPA: hypothetical protein [Caudoviricetes sp.]